MEFVTEDQAERLIRQHVKTSGRSRLAVAFWGDGACEKLDLAGRKDTVSVVCNLRMGGTNPHEIQKMQKLGIQVAQCDGLHAKVYLFDDGVLIGSSNASSNGLSFQDGEAQQPWTEANVFSDDPGLVASVSEWWSKLSRDPIESADIDLAIKQWELRRGVIRCRTEDASIVEKMKRSRTAFDGQNIFACFYSNIMTRAGLKALNREKTKYGADEELDAFEDWEDLPDTGTLICFRVGPRNGLSYDGCCRRQKDPPDPLILNTTLQLVWKVSDRPDLKVGPDMSEWRDILGKVQSSKFWNAKNRSAVINLNDIARWYH